MTLFECHNEYYARTVLVFAALVVFAAFNARPVAEAMKRDEIATVFISKDGIVLSR
jgi:hypothetical protein